MRHAGDQYVHTGGHFCPYRGAACVRKQGDGYGRLSYTVFFSCRPVKRITNSCDMAEATNSGLPTNRTNTVPFDNDALERCLYPSAYLDTGRPVDHFAERVAYKVHESTNPEADTVFNDLVKNGDIDGVRWCLEQCYILFDDDSSISMAARYKSYDVLDVLIDHHRDYTLAGKLIFNEAISTQNIVLFHIAKETTPPWTLKECEHDWDTQWRESRQLSLPDDVPVEVAPRPTVQFHTGKCVDNEARLDLSRPAAHFEEMEDIKASYHKQWVGDTVLQDLVNNGDVDGVRWCLDHGHDFRYIDTIRSAIHFKRYEMVDMLVFNQEDYLAAIDVIFEEAIRTNHRLLYTYGYTLLTASELDELKGGLEDRWNDRTVRNDAPISSYK